MYKSIKDLLERVDINSKDLECLGKSGALSELEPELNPLECGIYAKAIQTYFRKKEKNEVSNSKAKQKNDERLLSYQEELSVWEMEEEVRLAKWQERNSIRQNEIVEKIAKNVEAEKLGKRIVKVPDPIKPYEPKKKPELKSLVDLKKISEEPPRPREILSQKAKLDLEKDMLNIYLSGHPLDLVDEDKETLPIVDLLALKEEGHCIIRGVALLVKERNTRSKKLMASIQLEDRSGSIEVTVFPKTYEPLKDSLAAGKLYKIWGETDVSTPEVDEFDSDGETTKIHVSFKAKKIEEIIPHEKNDEWMILYPLLKGYIRILPGKSNINKQQIVNIFRQIALKYK